MRLILVFIMMSFSFYTLAENIYVKPIKGASISKKQLKLIEELVKASVEQIPGHRITSEAQAEISLQAKALKLGSSYVLQVIKYENGEKKYAAKMKSSSLEEMDVIAAKTTEAALNETSPSLAGTSRKVEKTEKVAAPLEQFEAIGQWQLGLGYASSSGMKVDGGSEMSWTVGYNWGVNSHNEVEVLYDYYTASDDAGAKWTSLSFGVNHFFSASTNAFFVGADLGYGAAEASAPGVSESDHEGAGWTTGLKAGIRFFRTSTISVGLVARYSYMWDEFVFNQRNPSMSSVRLAVYF